MSTAEAAPGRADIVGNRSERCVRLIAFPRENRSKVRLRKAEERSQHTTKYILHTSIFRILSKLPVGTYPLRGLAADLGAAGLGRRGIGLGVSASPEARGRHGELAKSKNVSQFHGLPRPPRPSTAGNLETCYLRQ